MALMNISPTTGKPTRKYTKAKRSATTAAQKQTGIKRQGRQRQQGVTIPRQLANTLLLALFNQA